jgi:hypothetical protein
VEATRSHRVGEVHSVACSANAGAGDAPALAQQLVEGGGVDDVIDLPPQPPDFGGTQSEQRLFEITDHRPHPVHADSPARTQLIEPVDVELGNQGVYGSTAHEQLLDEVAADEPRGAGQEVAALRNRARRVFLHASPWLVYVHPRRREARRKHRR